jgi:hypothetical protein
MSRYAEKPLSFDSLSTISLAQRGGKVSVSDFGRAPRPGGGVADLVEALPKVLAADAFRAVVRALEQARANRKAMLWGLGGHVIKCGLGDLLIDLMRRGWISAVVLNGAAAIHDFEIAIAGQTSEDVEAVLPDGSFGTAEETGREMNIAIAKGHRAGLGIGEALGKHLEKLAREEFAPHSVLLQAYLQSLPVTVHVALGADTTHLHPAADAAAIGAATHRDFRLLCALACGLNQGGVYLNIGSAVVLPEVFLKAVSAARNLGNPLREFVTVNFDFLQHYRPARNVVERPHARSGGRGYAITGHHELMIPLLAAALVARDSTP